jgi:hypothetical protein
VVRKHRYSHRSLPSGRLRGFRSASIHNGRESSDQ